MCKSCTASNSKGDGPRRKCFRCSDTFIPSSPMGMLFAAVERSHHLLTLMRGLLEDHTLRRRPLTARDYGASAGRGAPGAHSAAGTARHECGWKRTKCQIRQYPPPGIHPPPNMRIPERQCILRLTCSQGKAYMYCSAAPCGKHRVGMLQTCPVTAQLLPAYAHPTSLLDQSTY